LPLLRSSLEPIARAAAAAVARRRSCLTPRQQSLSVSSGIASMRDTCYKNRTDVLVRRAFGPGKRATVSRSRFRSFVQTARPLYLGTIPAAAEAALKSTSVSENTTSSHQGPTCRAGVPLTANTPSTMPARPLSSGENCRSAPWVHAALSKSTSPDWEVG
jgi:hypothetical protein